MDERIQEMRLKLDKISREPDQLEKNKQAFDFIVMYSDYLIQQVTQIESMAHVIKVKNKEMRELSNFLKERNIPLKELSPLITVMNQVQELESDIKANKKSVDWLLYQNQRYKEVLEFYANGINYQVFIENGKSNIEHDGGSKARQALRGES